MIDCRDLRAPKPIRGWHVFEGPRQKTARGHEEDVFKHLVTAEGTQATSNDVQHIAPNDNLFNEVDLAVEQASVKLFRITDASENPEFTIEHEGQLEREMFETSGALLVHANIGIYVW